MPELPDLEAIRGFLNQRLPAARIERAEAIIPVVFRVPKADFAITLEGNVMRQVERRGKFLLFALESGHVLVINPMLTGRFQYVPPEAKRRARTCMVLALANGRELRYSDERVMGKVYLVRRDNLDSIPQFPEMGPDALEVSREEFEERLRRHSGQIKNILLNHKFLAGIGNAYADEILFAARIHPYRKRPTLSDEEVDRLHASIGEVMRWAIPIVAEQMRDELDYEERRDFLRIHRKGGEPCPECGNRISEITAGQRITNFCRHCQPAPR
jgi:formamidopyrimidine-DNA glycosylase